MTVTKWKRVNPRNCAIKKCTKCLKILNLENCNPSFFSSGRFICKKCFTLLPSQTFEGHKHYKIKRYGITIEQYKELFNKQNGVCAICKEAETTKTKKLTSNDYVSLAVDHCHKTGKIRGLLCMKCNRGLGNLRDSIDILTSAIEYVKHSV